MCVHTVYPYVHGYPVYSCIAVSYIRISLYDNGRRVPLFRCIGCPICVCLSRLRRQRCEQSPRSLAHDTNSHATDHGAKKGSPTSMPARPAPMVPSREPPYQTRPPGTTPASATGLRHASTTEDFSSYTPGQHLRPGLVTLSGAHPERAPQARTQYWVVNPAVESLPRRVTISPQEPVFLGEPPQWHRCHVAKHSAKRTGLKRAFLERPKNARFSPVHKFRLYKLPD